MDDADFRDLQERVQLIKEMSSHPGWQLLVDRANAQMYQQQKRLILGKAKDWDDYKHMVAWMDGCSFVLNLPSSVEKEMIFEIDSRQEAEEMVES